VQGKFSTRTLPLTALILALALPFLVAGCKRAPGPDVVATVNGKPILRAELDRNYTNSLGDNPQQPTLPEQADITRLTVLRTMIEDEILQQRAAKMNLVATDEDVNAKLLEYKSPYTQEEFDKQLKQHNMTLDDLKSDLKKNLTKIKLLNKEIDSNINVTDAEISSYYTAHKSDFNVIEPRYHLAQIVVTGQPSQQPGNLQNNKAANDADARKKIEALHNHLVNGEDFGNIAINYSESGNSSNGGDMGSIPESALKADPSVFNTISKLKPGQISDVITIGGGDPSHRVIGYAIFKLLGHEAAGQREMNDPQVRQFIRQTLHDARSQLLKNAYYDSLHNNAEVHNYYAEQILKQNTK
jgi:peptidyl-prolyl cis-trans isomerase SurA